MTIDEAIKSPVFGHHLQVPKLGMGCFVPVRTDWENRRLTVVPSLGCATAETPLDVVSEVAFDDVEMPSEEHREKIGPIAMLHGARVTVEDGEVFVDLYGRKDSINATCSEARLEAFRRLAPFTIGQPVPEGATDEERYALNGFIYGTPTPSQIRNHRIVSEADARRRGDTK